MYKFKNNDMAIPAYVWSKQGAIEESALQQIKNAGNLPFAFHHVVLCPDAHLGYGAPIGGVMASRGYVVPNFVGSDIGCGMIAVKTSISGITYTNLLAIMGGTKENHGGIRSCIPVGFNHQSKKQKDWLIPGAEAAFTGCSIIGQEYESSLMQIGTLGSGNHFIEIQQGNDGYVWIMIHSGSRNLGYKVAKHYNDIAVTLNEKWFSQIPKKWELAFLPIDSNEGQTYLIEMQYCIEFALANRQLMMDRVKDCILDTLPGVEFADGINIAHNYAAMEHHFGKNVMVHRKGATRARLGELGIIPGSQGSFSYIVEGKGNADSFESCSHGAGRKMGRKQAQRELDLEDEIKRLDDMGVIHMIRSVKDLDESTGAYKDIAEVMANQSDLVNILVELKPLAVIKG